MMNNTPLAPTSPTSTVLDGLAANNDVAIGYRGNVMFWVVNTGAIVNVVFGEDGVTGASASVGIPMAPTIGPMIFRVGDPGRTHLSAFGTAACDLFWAPVD